MLPKLSLILLNVFLSAAAWAGVGDPLQGLPVSWTTATELNPPVTWSGGLFESRSITAFYGGNSANRLADDSGYGRHLKMVGSPIHLTAPAAPEGDRWLMGSVGMLGQGTGQEDYFIPPPSVLQATNGKLIGCMVFTYAYLGPGNVRTPIFCTYDMMPRGLLSFEVGMTKPVFIIAYLAAPPVSRVIYHGMEFGNTYVIRLEFRENWVEVFVDGRTVDCIDHPVIIETPPAISYMGTRGNLEYGFANAFMDAFMISTDPDEPYPPKRLKP